MLASVEQVDKQYRVTLERIHNKLLKQTYSHLVEQGPLPIDGNEVTKAILLRLRAFYKSQKCVKDFFNKEKIIKDGKGGSKGQSSTGAYFFEETLAFYLKALIETHKLGLKVELRTTIDKKKKSIRPDISIWKGDALLASIECKTQFGYSRKNWEAEFCQKEKKLQSKYPNARQFLVVMTKENWSGLENRQ